MAVDLQKAGIWKRLAAWILDVMLIAVLAVGIGALLSSLLKYDSYSQQLTERYRSFEQEYGVTFDVSEQERAAFTPEEEANFKKAEDALNNDPVALKALYMTQNLILLIVSLSLLFAILILEFFIPLWLGNGQTLGKKAFALGVVRIDSVKLSTLQLFARSVLGKYAVETMFPVFLVMMVLAGVIGIVGPVILIALLLTQLIMMGVTHTDSAIHDVLASTVVVDISSQQIFNSTDELIAYTKKIHAQEAERKEY